MAERFHDALQATYFLGFQRCLNCSEELIAAEGATLVPHGLVKFVWCCDLCGHKFETADRVDTTVSA